MGGLWAAFSESVLPRLDAKILDDAEKVTEVEMHCFIGIMFAMTVCPMSNIKEFWKLINDGLFLASQFHEKLHM